MKVNQLHSASKEDLLASSTTEPHITFGPNQEHKPDKKCQQELGFDCLLHSTMNHYILQLLSLAADAQVDISVYCLYIFI